MDGNPKGQSAHSYSVALSAPHRMLVCKACKHEGDHGTPSVARSSATTIVTREGRVR